MQPAVRARIRLRQVEDQAGRSVRYGTDVDLVDAAVSANQRKPADANDLLINSGRLDDPRCSCASPSYARTSERPTTSAASRA